MSDIYFDKIKDLIKSELKIHIDQYKDSYIARRVSVRMRLTKCKGYREYLELLKKTPEEYEKLENTLTVNVTEFWRDITVYREIKKIFEEKVKDSRVKSIKIWSAGCSSGEEPYGLAIILKELCEQYSRKFLRITINATDLDKEIVRKARQGIYIDKQFKNMDEDTINKYFTKIDRNHYQISSDIKKMVTFKNHDLIKEPPIYEMDFILCRNVIIYFGKEIQEILFNKYYEGLSDGGYLILGRTEMLHGEPREMFIPHNHRERIYQKIVGKNKRMGQNSTESSSVSVKNNQDIVKNTNTQSRLKSSEVKSSLKSTANTRSTRSTRSSVDNSSNIRSNSKNNNESTNRLNSSAKTTNRLTSKTKSTIKSTDKPVSRLSRYSSKNEVKSDKEERTKRTLTSSTTSSSRLIKKDTKDNDRTNKDRLKSRTEVKRTGISSKTSESESSRTLREKTRLTTRENINKDKEKRESKTVKKSSSLLSTKKKEQDSPKDLKEIRKSLQSLRNSKK
ncbi:chemotaxis protein methyltransferase CheR [Methanococcus voltae PS]|uniref:protein-glutamate O-methyltransferase n=1 Tax=Methanococcus voltae PS TaxID=523842 RepID=A0ABT2EUV9_METVO|nr:protein-glutamate O-methyltransferase CheR [Methanococcus voltae]MCS3921743.1 chemotaxis protein methyltransferase CheR [Methanococcus voltae PS]